MNEPKIGHCTWDHYETYSPGVTFRAEFTAHDLYEAMRKVVDHIHTYIDEYNFEEPADWDDEDLEYNFWLPENATQEERDAMGKKILDKIIDNNGDGCDFITLLEWNGEELIEEESELDNVQNWG